MKSGDNTATNSHVSTEAPCWFTTTQWSVVLSASPDSPEALEALERLCRTYWLPLYSYIRRKGYSPADAQDLTQGFFYRLLRLNAFAGVRREKGKFRTFLLAALNHFLSDEQDRALAIKRGRNQTVISLDGLEADACAAQAVSTDVSPEKLFDRQWALTILDNAMTRLREEHQSGQQRALFEALAGFLSRQAAAGEYSNIAKEFGMSANSAGVAVHRLRHRYRELVRLELSNTVSTQWDLDEEMNYLLAILSG